jgi:hypothetical protein
MKYKSFRLQFAAEKPVSPTFPPRLLSSWAIIGNSPPTSFVPRSLSLVSRVTSLPCARRHKGSVKREGRTERVALALKRWPGGFMNEERERLLEQVSEWVTSMDYVCRTPEVQQLIRRLEQEHGAYPQTVVNVDEN